ncbi:UDP-N-acetylmuramoyl-L-alanyl-D-glutamate--2,6-diaminopimelate ligase [Alicyclobacillaceae bacterium I2511]|nr:UDP-N-acetylmuramoyl-L-alanyl-D-glutamate--2,6-diaminopimelate ligase [Alicyclobacillaceae bacterium I2511]
MRLTVLRRALLKVKTSGFVDVEITKITSDSRRACPGALFTAIRGYTVDGHDFVDAAVAAGAVAVMVERPIVGLTVPQLVVPDCRLASAILADVFYGHPSNQLRMIGVTGTNGKTTVTHLIERVLTNAGHHVGLYGTIGKRIGDVTEEVLNTTPEAVDLQGIIHEMVEQGCTYGVMEVSSHALELRRVAGTRYHIAVFTNFTQDHLDFHKTMDAYLAAKGKLFSRLGNTYGDNRGSMCYAVLNRDDPAYPYLQEQSVMECITYGVHADSDFRASNILVQAEGTRFTVATPAGLWPIQLALTGRFNVYNALAALAVGWLEEIPMPQVIAALQQVAGIPGRLERVNAGQPFTILVDYSHTPDSLDNALHTVREFSRNRVVCVVGCGGDRDKGKRPQMAKIACELCDTVILTSDNPRTEAPESILDDMEAGVQGRYENYRRLTDRQQAIEWAIQHAAPDDVLLIAGKGHESYQIIGREKHYFDDREVAKTAVFRFYGTAGGE